MLTAKLAAIKAAVGGIGKDSTMAAPGQGNYKYRGIDSILEHLHQPLVEHEVSIYPTRSVPTYVDKFTANNKPQQWVSLVVTFEVRSGDEVITLEAVGEAQDTSDKATNKAHTAAFKVALSQLFAIPYGGDDPDHDRVENGRPEPAVVWTTEQEAHAAELTARLDLLPPSNYNRIILAARNAAPEFDIKAITDLPPSWLQWWEKAVNTEEAAAEGPELSDDSDADQG